MKIFGEARAAHEIAAQVQPAHFDTVRIGLTDVALCSAGFTNLHASPRAEYNQWHDIQAPTFGKARWSGLGMGRQPRLHAALRFA
jgi:hypothetical protein